MPSFFTSRPELVCGFPCLEESPTCSRAIPIGRVWSERDRSIFVRFAPPPAWLYPSHPPTREQEGLRMLARFRPDLELVWLGEIEGAKLAVLRQDPIDLDDEVALNYLVRLESPREIRTLSRAEFIPLRPTIARRMAEDGAILPEQAAMRFGAIPARDSNAFNAASLLERAIGVELSVAGRWLRPGERAEIVGVEPWGDLMTLKLASSPDRADSEQFDIGEMIERDGRRLCLLRPSRTIAPEIRWNLSLVHAETGGFRALNQEEYALAARHIVDALEAPRPGRMRRDFAPVTRPDWERAAAFLGWRGDDAHLMAGIARDAGLDAGAALLTNLALVRIADATFRVWGLGEPLEMTEAWIEENDLVLVLGEPGDPPAPQSSETLDFTEMVAERLIQFAGLFYLVAHHRPERLDPAAPPRLALRVEGAATLRTLTNDELGAVNAIYHLDRARNPPWSGEAILHVLRSYPSR